jgi:hypothetical protein
MAELGDPIRVIEIQPLELPVPSEMPSERPAFEPEPERETIEVDR